MKYLLFLLAVIINLAYPLNIFRNREESYGCMARELNKKCCWVNPNGCCAPPKIGQACTNAITSCCKEKVLDKNTNTYKYVFTRLYARTPDFM